MSKKSMIVLLILPFVLAVSFFAASSFLFTEIQGDITNIDWKYKPNEAFALTQKRIPLEATPILANGQEDVNATLVWNVTEKDGSDTTKATVLKEENKNYLKLNEPGDIRVTCTNLSGNLNYYFDAKIFEKGAIVVNTRNLRSSNSIEGHDYYGEYDFDSRYNKVPAEFYLDFEVVGDESFSEEAVKISTTDNVRYDRSTGKVSFIGTGDASIKFESSYAFMEDAQYDFTFVDEGVNVYNYSQLMKCTNESTEGEIVCLQVNLESVKNTYQLDGDKKLVFEGGKPIKRKSNTELFGNASLKAGTEFNKVPYNFENEVYRFTSTYNTEFIDQFNATASEEYKISKEVKAGVHITKDFYGNGFMINEHNLTYPYGETEVNGVTKATLTDRNLFRGPLPYVFIGNNAKDLIVESFGQDNVGFYVDGDDITLRDVAFKNCDFSTILQNNNYSGTVVDVKGQNVDIVNSHLSSGRVVLRSYSSTLDVKNSLLEKGREFIAKIGNNDYAKINPNEEFEFDLEGQHYKMTRREFFIPNEGENANPANADSIVGQVLFAGVSSSTLGISFPALTDAQLKERANILQAALNPLSAVSKNGELIYDGETNFEDTYFYQSGIFSLTVESLFNGPYLYNGGTSLLKAVLNILAKDSIIPNNIGGMSLPTKVNLIGDTRFYDYKSISETDISDLVYLNLSNMQGPDVSGSENITIDNFFPIKEAIKQEAAKKGYGTTGVREEGGKEDTYYNTAFVKYGGSLNNSVIDTSMLEIKAKEAIGESMDLDFFRLAMQKATGGSMENLLATMIGRCVPIAAGYAPFEANIYNGNGYLFGEKIARQNLINRAKGAY